MKKINKIIIEVIDHGMQRYETVGDYYFDVEGNLRIYVSKLGDNRFELLVMIHELIEVLLTEHNGIPEPDCAKYDIEFERNRKPGDMSEPGDDPTAPYVNEHCIATGAERMMASLLSVYWKEYENACNELSKGDGEPLLPLKVDK